MNSYFWLMDSHEKPHFVYGVAISKTRTELAFYLQIVQFQVHTFQKWSATLIAAAVFSWRGTPNKNWKELKNKNIFKIKHFKLLEKRNVVNCTCLFVTFPLSCLLVRERTNVCQWLLRRWWWYCGLCIVEMPHTKNQPSAF